MNGDGKAFRERQQMEGVDTHRRILRDDSNLDDGKWDPLDKRWQLKHVGRDQMQKSTRRGGCCDREEVVGHSGQCIRARDSRMSSIVASSKTLNQV